MQFIFKVFGEENACQLITHFNDLWKGKFQCTSNEKTTIRYIATAKLKGAQ